MYPPPKRREILVTNRKTCISIIKFLYIYWFFLDRSDLANCILRDSPEFTGGTSPLPKLMTGTFDVQLPVYDPGPIFTSGQLTLRKCLNFKLEPIFCAKYHRYFMANFLSLARGIFQAQQLLYRDTWRHS